MSWMNKDGLYVKYGTEEGEATVGGALNIDGRNKVISATLTLSEAGLNAAVAGAGGGVVVPKGAFIEKVRITVTTAAVGATAALNIGLIKASDRTTELDYNGLVAAEGVGDLTLGAIIEYTAGGTSAGALVGTALTESGVLTMDYDTAAFTAGVIDVEIFYS